MNLYQLLRQLAEDDPRMSETLKHDADALITRLQETNALGTVTGRTEETGHECYFPPRSDICIYCQQERK